MPWYSAADARCDAERIGRANNWANVGDMLIPKPEWNSSEGQKRNHLPTKVEVLDVIPSRSQSGVLYRVRMIGGDVRDLDAGWFETPNAKSEPTARLFAQVGSTDGLCPGGTERTRT